MDSWYKDMITGMLQEFEQWLLTIQVPEADFTLSCSPFTACVFDLSVNIQLKNNFLAV